MKLSPSEAYCYSSKTFTITCDGENLFVFRERDKTLIETVHSNSEELDGDFDTLKTKYIFDYANVL